MADDRITEEMRKAIAAYAGPATRCPPGHARGPASDKPDRDDGNRVTDLRADRWLNRHSNDRPVVDPKAERRRLRMARAQRGRIVKRNAAVRKRNGLGTSTGARDRRPK